MDELLKPRGHVGPRLATSGPHSGSQEYVSTIRKCCLGLGVAISFRAINFLITSLRNLDIVPESLARTTPAVHQWLACKPTAISTRMQKHQFALDIDVVYIIISAFSRSFQAVLIAPLGVVGVDL
jgi:hypothetical protein